MVVMSKNEVESTLKMVKGFKRMYLQVLLILVRAHDTIDRIVRGDTENLVITKM